MIFKQLFEPVSSTYSYLLACPETGACALIDPVIETVPGNQQCGRCPDNVPEEFRGPCERWD